VSNLEDEKLIAHARIYHETVRKLREQNAEKEKLKAEWEANNGPKPTLDMVMGGPLKSEEEISKIATQTAIYKQQEQEDLERIGAVEPTSEKPSRGSLEAFFGDDKEAMQKAREDQERRQRESRQRELERERDSNGRDMEP
jgi:hypothetical protein